MRPPRSTLFYIGLTALTAFSLACTQPPPPGFEGGDETEEGDSDDEDSAEETDETSDSATDDTDDTDDTDATESDTDAESDTEETESDAESDTDDPPNAFADTYYPLADGATWVYIDKTHQGQVLGMEEVTMTAMQWEGQEAFLQADSPGEMGKWTDAVLMRDGDDVFRVHKEIQTPDFTESIVDYDPGFLRASDAWSEVDQFEERLYVRTETDGNGQNPDVEDRGHYYTVLAIDEEVTVPAGTFNCILVERVRSVGGNIGDRVLFWYALGVGKVKEDRPAEQKIEELYSVSIPGGLDLP